MFRRRPTGSGSHGPAWVVSFADLMALLMAFFVMLLSFSIQDQEKLKQAAGSVQDAFGIIESEMLSAPDDPHALGEEAAGAAAERILQLAVAVWRVERTA